MTDTKAKIQTLNEAAEANRQTGVLLLCKEALVTAIQDRRRLDRGHLSVLAAIATFMSSRTAKAWPGRAAIAAYTGMTPKTVSNLLLELRTYGYLIADKEAVEEAGNRMLTVYTFGNIDHETVRNEITKFVHAFRDARKVPPKKDSPATAGSPVPAGLPSRAGHQVPPQTAATSRPSGDSNSSKKLTDNKLASHDPIDQMIADTIKWMPGGNEKLATEWLKTTLVAYGQDAVRDAYVDMKGRIAKGEQIADKIRYWSKVSASRMKEQPRAKMAAFKDKVLGGFDRLIEKERRS